MTQSAQFDVLKFINNHIRCIHDDVSSMFTHNRISRRRYSKAFSALAKLGTELGAFVELQKQYNAHAEQDAKALEENTALRVKARMWDELAHRIQVGSDALVQHVAQSTNDDYTKRLNAKLSGVKLVQEWMRDMEHQGAVQEKQYG